jgi:hypothetical protein
LTALHNSARITAEFAMKNRKKTPEIAILVGCVGRKLVMNQVEGGSGTN